MNRALPRAPNIVPTGARVVVATPVPGGEVKVGHTGSVAAGLGRANLAVRWAHDGKLRRVHRKRLLYTEDYMAESIQDIADRNGGLPVADDEYVTVDVTTHAALALPVGSTVVPDCECAVRLPTGQLLKFWVVAELVDDATDTYENLNYQQLKALGVVLEPTGGSAQAR